MGEIAERYQCLALCDDDLRFLQSDDAEEQADACGNCELKIFRNRIDDVFAYPKYRDQEEDHARAEHTSKRLLPAVLVTEHDREGEERIESHPGRQGDRIIRIECHHQGGDRSRDAGGHKHRALVHSGIAEDLRIDEHDVDHGQECGQPCDEFGTNICAVVA